MFPTTLKGQENDWQASLFKKKKHKPKQTMGNKTHHIIAEMLIDSCGSANRMFTTVGLQRPESW